ncbi:hypothetical protein RvY_13302 [Ramazzottius varieornatus]|uniref:Thiamin pyrophosphokinase thiamin-binding domain-containing protein n=1 Tax=Ramazzottius varieornatus TaxID=947166 RepID=A0A1D1VSR6_RAMVA|nr:hypothetical protein RvY_13302 [Ramazzottius varieornatus]
MMSRSIRLLDCLRPSACRIALIFLHTELSVADFAVHRKKIEILWRNAVFKCAADSGANFLYRHLCTDANGKPDPRSTWLPDLICGDFDSAEPEVLKFFKSFPSVRIEKTPDQDATDFTKALKLVGEILRNRSECGEPDGLNSSSSNVDMIVAVCSGRGRFDHSMGNINTLFSSAQYTNLPVILMSETDMQYVIPGGTAQTMILDTGLEGPYCGLLPLSGPSIVSTSGLQWNLFNETLSFGGLISTSNSLDRETVMVKCSEPLLWTMSVKNLK